MNGKKARAQRKMFPMKDKSFLRALRKRDKTARLTGVPGVSKTPAVPNAVLMVSVGARSPQRYHPVRSAFNNATLELNTENPSLSAFQRAQKIHELRYYGRAGRMSKPELERYIARA